MPFNRPTLQQLVTRITTDFSSRIIGATSFLRRSTIKIMGIVYAGAVYLVYGYLEYQSLQLFITDMDDENLVKAGAEYGVNQTPTAKSTGTGLATGTVGKIITEDSEIQSDAGLKYIIDADYTIPASGEVDISFIAEEAGANYNDDAGIELTFVSPIPGVDTIIIVDTAGVINGLDIEDLDLYRARVLTRKRKPPHGGASFDYVEWVKEVAGNTRAWAFKQYNGKGTVGVAFVRDNDTPIIPDSTERATTREYIVSHTDSITGETVGCPVGAEPGLFMIALSLKAIDFNIAITPNTAAIQAAGEQKLRDLFLASGGPGVTISKSQFTTAIGAIQNESAHEIADNKNISSATNEVPVLGTVTWSTYNG